MKQRKIVTSQKRQGMLFAFTCAFSILTAIFGIARLFGAKLGARYVNFTLLNKFGNILTHEQQLIAKDQIYNSSVNKVFIITFFCTAAAFLILLLLNQKALKENIKYIKEVQNQNESADKNINQLKRKFFEYTPEIIIAIPTVVLLSLCIARLCNPFTYQSYFNNLYVQSDLLNLSSDQIEQINKVVDKENLIAKIVLPIFALCVLAVAIGIITYMNTGPDFKIEHGSSLEKEQETRVLS